MPTNTPDNRVTTTRPTRARSHRQARKRPEALGTAERLPSGRWRAYYSRDAQRFTAPHTFATRAEAQDWLAAERSDRARGTWRDPRVGRLTLKQFATD